MEKTNYIVEKTAYIFSPIYVKVIIEEPWFFTNNGGTDMKTVMADKKYEKMDKSTKKVISQGISKLQSRYEYYDGAKCIFNDDTLVHDIIRKHYYVYKCRVDKIQLRILYLAIDNNIIIISSYIKKKNTKEYIALFEKAVSDYENMNWNNVM